MAGVMWRELARRVIKTQLAAGVHKTEEINSPPVPNGIFFFSCLKDTGGRRRQALAP